MLLAADAAGYFFHRAAHRSHWLYRSLHRLRHEHAGALHTALDRFCVSCQNLLALL